MAGGKGAHVGSRFIHQLRMKRALGIPSSHRMWPVKQTRGRDHRRGTWWNWKLNCIAIEGQDFAQDTQEGGADQFEFELIPDLDEQGAAKGSSPLLDNDEYVPETEPQDVVTVSKITRPCANQGRQSLGNMLHEWLQLISDVENESGKVDMESSKVQMDSVKLENSGKMEMDSEKLEMCAKVQMGSVKLVEESGKVEVESDKFEMCAKVQMDSVKLEKESGKVKVESDKFEMCAKVQMGSVKFEESALVEMYSDKLEMLSPKVEMDSGKEELDHIASFSDLETDDEACWLQDGVDLRGHSQVEDDDVNEQGLLIVFVIRVRQLLFVKYDLNSMCIHAKVVYDIIQGFLGLPVDHLNQMDGQRCHLVQKQGDDYENALSPTCFLVLPVDHLNEMDAQHCHLVQKQANDNENALSLHT